MSVVIETTMGDITVDLYLKERPTTSLNFLKLCKIKYYNLCVFYKIEKNFIAQAGDPTATGRGGESIFCHLYGEQAKYFDAEFKPRLKHEKLGTLSMVNNGNNMNGSQFFITLSENLTYLDENHTVFGEVTEGFDILQKLNDAICDNNNRPYQDIRITHTVILHDPFEDPKGLEIPETSPEPTREMLESNYIGADEEINDNEGKTAEEIEEKIKESEAKARATILEMVGDIPDADVRPPENVLFVCKLNPVTTSEDLEIIFSRFGNIVSCEVIKDKKTGESLQYAFIEFEKEEDCEAAYFKMDNVLIDDRRIHVDFSQSVSKMNLEKDKSLNSKQQSNIFVKKTDRNDGYDLIFDMEEDISRKDKDRELRSREFESEKKKQRKDMDKIGHGQRYKNNYRFEKHRSIDSDEQVKLESRHSSHSTYRESKYHKKSPESFSNRRASEKKSRYYSVSPDRQRINSRIEQSGSSFSKDKYDKSNRFSKYDSVSPDRQRTNSRKKEQSGSSFSKYKYSDKPDRHDYSKSKSYKDSERSRNEISSYKHKTDADKKTHSSDKHKSSKNTRKPPISSSSSSSDSDSSSSTSSSDSKHKKKYHRQKEKDLSISRNTHTSHKKKKYNT